MEKGAKILLVIWSILALACFVSTIWMPVLIWKIINVAFGVMNVGLILVIKNNSIEQVNNVQLQEKAKSSTRKTRK